MKAILEAGITWLKNKLYQKTADVLAETVKKSVEESIINKIEPVREKVTTPIDSLSKAHDRITKTFKEKQAEAKTLTEKGRWLTEALSEEEESSHSSTDSSNQPDFIASEPTKAHFDVKLYDAVEDVEYDKRIVVEHRVERRHPSVVAILNIEEKARSARNHKPDRNLVDDRSPNLPQAIRTYYELSGIQVKEIYHLHLPGTKIQTV